MNPTQTPPMEVEEQDLSSVAGSADALCPLPRQTANGSAMPSGEPLPRFTWSRVDPGDMDYTEATFGFGSKEDAERFRRRLTNMQTADVERTR